MKILLITSFFPPTHTAGTEKRTLGYALQLKTLGYEVQVLCAGTFDQGEKYWNGYTDEVQQIPVRRIHLNWILAPDPNRFLYDNPIVAVRLEQWLKEWQPDVVHITSCYTLSASVIQVVKEKQIPLVLTLTDFWFICPRLNLLRGDGSLCDGRTSSWDCLECMLWNTKIYRSLKFIAPDKVTKASLQWASKQPRINKIRGLRGYALDMAHRKSFLAQMIEAADQITAPSTYLSELIKASGVSKPIEVIHSGHDLSWLEALPEKKDSPTIRFGYIGQIIPIKGVHILVDAFAKANLNGAAQLTIFGNTEQNPGYINKLKTIAGSSLPAIHFRGPFPPHRLGEILAEIDVLIVPSQWHENNPRVIQEAFAGKTPVIASDVGGISEFVQHNVNGLLFERTDKDQLARHLHQIVMQPDLLKQLQATIPPVKRMEEEIGELVKIYQELVSQDSPEYYETDRNDHSWPERR